MPRHDDRIDARSVCGTHAGPQVVWILYAIQHQQGQVRVNRLQALLHQRSQARLIKNGAAPNFSNNPLMARLAADLLQAGTIGSLNLDTVIFGCGYECFDARIRGLVFGVEPLHIVHVASQQLLYGSQTRDVV